MGRQHCVYSLNGKGDRSQQIVCQAASSCLRTHCHLMSRLVFPSPWVLFFRFSGPKIYGKICILPGVLNQIPVHIPSHHIKQRFPASPPSFSQSPHSSQVPHLRKCPHNPALLLCDLINLAHFSLHPPCFLIIFMIVLCSSLSSIWILALFVYGNGIIWLFHILWWSIYYFALYYRNSNLSFIYVLSIIFTIPFVLSFVF